MILLFWWACSKDETAGHSARPTEQEPWEVAADGIPGGTLLSAWSDGDVLRFVGGDLSSEASSGVMVEWDGTSFCVREGWHDATLWWIAGLSAGDYFVVGARGTILHVVDGVVTNESIDVPDTLFGVFVHDDGTAYAVGGDVYGSGLGTIWVRQGGSWSPFAQDLPSIVFKTWSDWFVGDGRSWRLEDGALVEYAVEGEPKLLTTRGRSDDEVFAVGGVFSPSVVQSSGGEWTEIAFDLACSSQPLTGVWTAPGEDVWIAGMTGAVGRWDGAAWTCPPAPITYEHFHAVWQHEGEMWWAGGNLLSAGANYGTVGHYGSPVGLQGVEPCP